MQCILMGMSRWHIEPQDSKHKLLMSHDGILHLPIALRVGDLKRGLVWVSQPVCGIHYISDPPTRFFYFWGQKETGLGSQQMRILFEATFGIELMEEVNCRADCLARPFSKNKRKKLLKTKIREIEQIWRNLEAFIFSWVILHFVVQIRVVVVVQNWYYIRSVLGWWRKWSNSKSKYHHLCDIIGPLSYIVVDCIDKKVV